MNFKKIKALALSLVTAASVVSSMAVSNVSAKYGTGMETVEHLDRGIVAVNTGNGMMVSWRFLADDADSAVFKLYRDNNLIYTSDGNKATSFLDKSGTSSSSYKVETVVNGAVQSTDTCHLTSNQPYLNIPLDIPKGGSDYTYSANDCSVGDVDGDGQYEIFVKWDPSNSKDNSQSGYTGNVYIDCYTLEGKKLWRIDLGKNIRAGAHYTQFLVADFDLDGKAEMTCKTADGTVDGKGKVIGDASKDYRNSGGYILSGPEYYTLFDGATGAALDTVSYEYPRGEVSKKTWGDDYGNRCDRFLGSVCYLDGVHPSAVSIRGYYTRMTAVAYDVVNKKLVKRWGYDTGYNASAPGYADGNHNCMPADVDGDGRQELVVGATCFDDNGKVLWCNELGHGDAMHLSDFLPDRKGQELWVCHEHEPYGVSLLDAATGKTIFHYDHGKDTGRCAAGNIYAGNPGAEFWGAQSGDVYDANGKATGVAKPAQNFLIYWDGDLERELLDGTSITTINSDKKIVEIFNAEGCSSNNGTKSTPNFSGDILGDWREELVMKTTDSKYLRVYCTPYETDTRVTTLMHDTQYRNQCASEQNCYNQPPHPSFFLGTGYNLPERPAVTVLGGSMIPPYTIEDGNYIKSVKVNDTANMQKWSVQSNLAVGDEVFGDRAFKFTSVPEQLAGAEWLKTSCDSKKYASEQAAFMAGDDITVYLGLDYRLQTVPEWLNGWEKTDMTMTDDEVNPVTFNIYKKDFKSGETVNIGAINNGSVINVTLAVKAYEPVIEYIQGDMNDDKIVNSYDLVLMRKAVVSMPSDKRAKLAADMNNDGVINVADLVLLQKFILAK